MKKLDQDFLRDIAINIVDKLVDEGLIPDCTNTDNSHEFDVQDIIVEILTEKLTDC